MVGWHPASTFIAPLSRLAREVVELMARAFLRSLLS